jgi:mRNA interferase YafO
MQDVPDWGVIYTAFYNYKLCGILPDNFGRDAYIHPRPLYHLQVTTNPIIIARWSKTDVIFKRTVLKDVEAEHDHWLLYAHDVPGNRYLLLAIFGPNAHQDKDRDNYLRTLKVEVVDPWMTGTLTCYEPPEDD